MAVSPRFSWTHPQEWDAWVPGEAYICSRRFCQTLFQSDSKRLHAHLRVKLVDRAVVILKMLSVLVGVWWTPGGLNFYFSDDS